MRWLLHGNLAPAVAEALRRYGHQAQTTAEASFDSSSRPLELLQSASRLQLDVMTTDASLANAPFVQDGGVAFGRSIVFLQLEGDEVEQDDAVDRLFERYKRLAPGRLYTVTATRVKVRQLPGKK